MTVVETIQQKLYRLPLQAQQEVLEIVEQVESRYQTEKKAEHPFALLAKIQIDAPPDFAERHDFYCHGKLED
jgi:hypothetical protein